MKPLKNSIKVLGREREELQKENKALHTRLEYLNGELEAGNNLNQRISEDLDRHHKANTDWSTAYKKLEGEAKKLTDNYNDLERRLELTKQERNKHEFAALVHRSRHQSLRERIVHMSSWTAAAVSSFLAYKYCPRIPKTAAFFTGATALISSYIWGSKYIQKCYAQDMRDAQH